MKFLFAVTLVACLAAAHCSPVQDDREEPVYQPRMLSTIHKAVDMLSNFRNRTLNQNLMHGAGVAADVALNAVLGPLTAIFAKQGMGLAGEALVSGSNFVEDKIKEHAMANNTFAQMLFDRAEMVGKLMSEYGGGKRKVQGAIDLAGKVAAGDMTVQEALRQGGVSLADDALRDAKLSVITAALSMEATGGIVEILGDSMTAMGSTSVGGTVNSVNSVLSVVGADKAFSAASKAVDKVLKTNIEESFSSKIAEIDKSSASRKEKMVAVGRVMDAIGNTLESIGRTADGFGRNSVADYPALIKEAINKIKVEF